MRTRMLDTYGFSGISVRCVCSLTTFLDKFVVKHVVKVVICEFALKIHPHSSIGRL
jgi:hypothetical protein